MMLSWPATGNKRNLEKGKHINICLRHQYAWIKCSWETDFCALKGPESFKQDIKKKSYILNNTLKVYVQNKKWYFRWPNNERFYNCIKIRLLKKFSFYSFSGYVRSVPFYLMPVSSGFVINNHYLGRTQHVPATLHNEGQSPQCPGIHRAVFLWGSTLRGLGNPP